MNDFNNFNHVVMFSSGIGSWACAKRVAEKYGVTNLYLLFADTGIEDEDNYRFLHESSKNIRGELIIVRDERTRTPWDVFNDDKYISHRAASCSRKLKIKPCEKYIKENSKFRKDNTIIYFGIDWEEINRLEKIKSNWIKYCYDVQAPLCWGDDWITKNDCLKLCISENIKPPRLYDLGFSHANCGGFCIKAGKKHFKNLYNKLPDVYKHHEQKELEFRQNIKRNDISILREMRKGIFYYITLKELRERIESEQLNLFDDEAIGGCGCFIDD